MGYFDLFIYIKYSFNNIKYYGLCSCLSQFVDVASVKIYSK